MSIRLRDMTGADLDGVLAIESVCFPDPWTRGMFEDELCAPNRCWLVAVEGERLIGYGGTGVFEDAVHVLNLAVSPENRRAGAGRALLETLLDRAVTGSGLPVTLEVRATNAAAIKLYQEHGFKSAGVRPGYYPGGEDALIMWREVCFADTTLILAIESSCDETAAAVLQGGDTLLSNVVASQIDFHSRFGGVVPEIAGRKHTEAIVGVVAQAMEEAGAALGLDEPLAFCALDAIAVTRGPGLVGALVVGVAYAKGLSVATGVPLVGVNHLEGHIFANVLADAEVRPPLVALLVSGGHTSLVHMPEWGVYETMGATLDDATGEAFDKVAKVLGLGYPGGPILSRMAAQGNPAAIAFPRAMIGSGDYKFSLSGLKTAVINHIRHEREAGREIDIPDLAASFQQAVIDVQVFKAVKAVREVGAVAFCIAGGVAANQALRDALRAAIEPLGVHVSVPPFELCTDNAAMIAAAGHYRFMRGEFVGPDAEADPGLRIDDVSA